MITVQCISHIIEITVPSYIQHLYLCFFSLCFVSFSFPLRSLDRSWRFSYLGQYHWWNNVNPLIIIMASVAALLFTVIIICCIIICICRKRRQQDKCKYIASDKIRYAFTQRALGLGQIPSYGCLSYEAQIPENYPEPNWFFSCVYVCVFTFAEIGFVFLAAQHSSAHLTIYIYSNEYALLLVYCQRFCFPSTTIFFSKFCLKHLHFNVCEYKI